ncbi:MAG: VWA domain-containing protein, partial [Oscillospiraceae bacterium]|nr:VWA domain-containing protein [Oscillospiraceae bacterium]
GTQVTETTTVGANVLIVFDRTRSMEGSMPGATNRLTAAKSAVAKLVQILSTGENAGNDIDYSLVSFYRQADEIHTWGTDGISGRTSWTKNGTVFNNYVQSLSVPSWNQNGTNWEAGLYQARQALNNKDNDTTYVIFLTDGEPNRRGTTTSTNADTATAITYALTQAQAITGTANVKLYGVFCGADSGYDNLADMITNARGVQTINGTDSTTLENAFANIAQTIVENIGASDVAVDDGVPSLSGISANVVGEAGGYEYFIKGKDDTEFSVWAEAPSAIYSSDNGVTWDLGSVGTLPADATYRIRFTVWPSQAAYDLIADLNNGIKDYDDLPADQKAAVTGSKEAGYTLVTNTHLNTTYTFNNTEYSDAPEELTYGSMPLPTSTVSVIKEWPDNMIDEYGAAVYRDPVTGETKTATEIELTLQRDSADYLKITVKGSEGWKKSDIYISSGNMTVVDGVATIHETGHDYQIVEPPQFMYYWDLISDIYHPMVINGVNTLLVLDVDATSDDVDNSTCFAIGKNADGTDRIYKVNDDSQAVLKASNYRRSNLNLTKNIFDYDGKTAVTDENAVFTYKATVTDSYSSDGKVWFSAFDPATNTLVKEDWATGTEVEAELDAQNNRTGYFYAPNGTELTLTIKAGWNVRFLNVYHGTTFSFEETDMPEKFEFGSVAANTQYTFVHTSNADWYKIAENSTTGKISGT